MKLPSSLSSRAELLSFLRLASELANLAEDDDTKLLLAAGIVPKAFLIEYCKKNRIDYPQFILDELTSARWGSQKKTPKVIESESYFRANIHNRTRPTLTKYDADKPNLKYGLNARYTTTLRIAGRDRMLIWYAAANQAATAAKGESYGLWILLQFMRLPHIQRAFRRWKKSKGQPQFPLPEDAR